MDENPNPATSSERITQLGEQLRAAEEKNVRTGRELHMTVKSKL